MARSLKTTIESKGLYADAELPLRQSSFLVPPEVVLGDSDGRPMLVWDYVGGQALEEAVDSMSEDQRVAVRREVMLAIESLHAAGLAHGAIHERNVILDPHGRVRLTHVSPLLYDDPQVDRDEADAMFDRLGFAPAPGVATIAPEPVQRPDPLRVRALVGAALAAMLGLLLVVSIVWYASVE